MSRIIEGAELEKLESIIEITRKSATKATCNRDHRGATVFTSDFEVISTSSNGPFPPFECVPAKCDRVCGLYAMHAERVALIEALDTGKDLTKASILHARISEGHIQISGGLRCEDCTGLMMRFLRKDIRLHEFILLQHGGWTAYTIPEADEITRRNLGLNPSAKMTP